MRNFKLALVILLALIALISFGTIANASTLTNSKAFYDPYTKMLHVEGTIKDATALDLVTIVVYRPTYTPEMLDSNTAYSTDAISNMTTAYIDANGNFDWNYKITNNDKDGVYTVHIYYKDINETLTTDISNTLPIMRTAKPTNQNNEEITKYNIEDLTEVNLNLQLNDDSFESSNLFVAFYNDNVLVSIIPYNGHLQNGLNTIQIGSIPTTSNKMKIICWDSFNYMNSIMEPYVIGLY